jgi:putative spermidine/putrescine transport system ATP-binding protein
MLQPQRGFGKIRVGQGSQRLNDLSARTSIGNALVSFIGVQKSYDGATLAVRDLTLDVARGEFLTLLGPSGSGKTTTLNMLAGFERPTRGEILLSGRPVARLPPYERNIGMVFQNYALFPHMTVAENVAFPLRARRQSRADIGAKVARALAMVRLDQFGERRPAQLSGGQQQRVALARALVFEPSLVLMDEPLGALDKKLREHMQVEIKLLHERLGLTVVYVTHDQSEALTMSDRIAVFHDGRVVQIGSPTTLYSSPCDPFVAAFIGENNLLSGKVAGTVNSFIEVELSGGLTVRATAVGPLLPGQPVQVAIRPEAINLADQVSQPTDFVTDGRIVSRIYLGDHQRLIVELQNHATLSVKVGTGKMPDAGENVRLGWRIADCLAFPSAEMTDQSIHEE